MSSRPTEPEVDYVPPSSYFVSQRGWGRRFSSRPAALEYVDFLLAEGVAGASDRHVA